MNADIILFDEPTTGLDPIAADAINDLIVDLRKKLGVTSVSITRHAQCIQDIGPYRHAV